MSRKLITIAFLFALLFAGLGSTPANANTTWNWIGYGPEAWWMWDLDTSHPIFEYGYEGYGTADWYLYHIADATGPVILSYQYQGYHGEVPYDCGEVWLWAFVTHNGATTWHELEYEEFGCTSNGYASFRKTPIIQNGFSFEGSVQLEVETGDEYGFALGGSSYPNETPTAFTLFSILPVISRITETGGMHGALWVNTGGIYQPTVIYNMWLLTKNDGSYCILKSPTHPSVESQNRLCMPEKYNNSWVADNVACVGTVNENGFWTCAAEFLQWKEANK